MSQRGLEMLQVPPLTADPPVLPGTVTKWMGYDNWKALAAVLAIPMLFVIGMAFVKPSVHTALVCAAMLAPMVAMIVIAYAARNRGRLMWHVDALEVAAVSFTGDIEWREPLDMYQHIRWTTIMRRGGRQHSFRLVHPTKRHCSFDLPHAGGSEATTKLHAENFAAAFRLPIVTG